MESGIQSSFIPPDAQMARGTKREEGTILDVVMLISLVLCIAAVVSGVGLFLYQQYLGVSIKSKADTIERARNEFQPALIHDMTRLDDRMNSGELILQNHVAPSRFFEVLNQVTLSNISFQNMSFDAGDGKTMSLQMSGFAQSLNSIALQADLLSKNGMITSPIFSGINRNGTGFSFSLSAFINPLSIRYIQARESQTNQQVDTPPTTPGAPVSPFDGQPMNQSPSPAGPLVLPQN